MKEMKRRRERSVFWCWIYLIGPICIVWESGGGCLQRDWRPVRGWRGFMMFVRSQWYAKWVLMREIESKQNMLMKTPQGALLSASHSDPTPSDFAAARRATAQICGCTASQALVMWNRNGRKKKMHSLKEYKSECFFFLLPGWKRPGKPPSLTDLEPFSEKRQRWLLMFLALN